MSKAQFLESNLAPGEEYAGIILGKDGNPDYHLFLLPGEDEYVFTWDQAGEFARECGGELPTRREQYLLFANLKEQFKDEWYWSGEEPSDQRFAWLQDFGSGFQDDRHKNNQFRARAVRRVEI